MAPKNKKKNAFYFFMKEMQERQAAKGIRIPISEMPNLAHPIWAQLSIVERQPYEDQAKAFNQDPTLRGGKLASDGTRVEDNLREEQEKENQENTMKQGVRSYVNTGCIADDQFKAFASRKVFYFISFNILCHTETEYIPNEVGLIEYSLEHGIMREYHALINPGRIPTGFTGDAKRMFEKHAIDIFGEACAEKYVNVVYNNIKGFVNPAHDDEYPPLFTSEESLHETRGCLQWLGKDIRKEDKVHFDVWNSKYLLMELRAGVEHPLPSGIIAGDLLNKSSFNYHPEARCKFHDEKDVHDCALAYSKRLCYLLSDATCHLFDIQLTEKHLPCRAVEDKEYVITLSSDSTKSKGSLVPSVPIRLDQKSNYYQNNEEQFSDALSDTSTSTMTKSTPDVPRQPESSCIAAEMSRLKLNMMAATVPGHGIGRGQRRNM